MVLWIQSNQDSRPLFRYRVAEIDIVTDALWSEFARFQTENYSKPTDQHYPVAPVENHSVSVYSGPGWVGGELLDLACRAGSVVYVLSTGHGHQYQVQRAGHWICRTDDEMTVTPKERTAAIWGPALILALALRGVKCLHASAVMRNGRVIAFIGDSGTGKSTLARFLNEQDGAEFRRIADDVLPVELTHQSVMALPHFPQLKLPPHEQVGPECPRRVPLETVYVLETQDREAAVAWHPLTKSAATLSLLSHTVAARLFDAGLLRSHLSLCAEAAASLPVRRLVYPRRFDALPTVLALLQRQ